MGANAAKSAASTEASAFNQASTVEQNQFDQTKGFLQPFQTGGTNALAALQKLLNIGPGTSGGASSPILQMLGIGTNGQPTGSGINPATFQGSPGYQYQLQQGTNAVTNSAAANGGLGGNALRALQSTGQGLANQNFQQYLQNVSGGYQGLVGNLSNLTGTGATAANSLASASQNLGESLGSNTIGAGEAIGSGILGSATAIGSGILGSAKALGGGVTGVGQNALLASLMNGGGGGSGGIGNFLSNLFSGASASANSQYSNPYGATGLGQVIVGSNGLSGGGT
jgi:hypothetical protein